MAAARRGSESGVTVVLVICVVLAVIGIGGGIYCFQQLLAAKKAIAIDQSAFATAIDKQFKDNGWNMPSQTPSQLGVTFTPQSYDAAGRKLAEAAEYEKVVRPLLGWDSPEGLRTALSDSALQKEAVAEGVAPYTQLSALLGAYDTSYTTLSGHVADLTGKNTDLTNQLDDARKTLLAQQEESNKKLADTEQKFNDSLTTLNAGFNDVKADADRQRQDAVAWQQKCQQEAQGREQDVAKLRDEATKWQKMYEDAVAGAIEGEQMVADGKVLDVKGKYKFVMIQGGKDREVKENDVYVVYEVTPDGKSQAKGVIVVGQVNEHTSLATISQEQKYIIQGDLFVSQAKWDHFHTPATAEVRTGG